MVGVIDTHKKSQSPDLTWGYSLVTPEHIKSNTNVNDCNPQLQNDYKVEVKILQNLGHSTLGP